MRYKPTSGGSWTVDSAYAPFITLDSLSDGQSYWVQVRQICADTLDTLSVYGDTLTFTATKHASPRNAFLSYEGAVRMELSWPKMAGASYYELRYRISGGGWDTLTVSDTAQIVMYEIDSLIQDTIYEFQARCVYPGANYSAFCGTIEGRTRSVPVPEDLDVRAYATTLDIDWLQSQSDIKPEKFEVAFRTNGSGGGTWQTESSELFPAQWEQGTVPHHLIEDDTSSTAFGYYWPSTSPGDPGTDRIIARFADLTPATEYEVRMRSDMGNGQKSEWTQIDTVETVQEYFTCNITAGSAAQIDTAASNWARITWDRELADTTLGLLPGLEYAIEYCLSTDTSTWYQARDHDVYADSCLLYGLTAGTSYKVKVFSEACTSAVDTGDALTLNMASCQTPPKPENKVYAASYGKILADWSSPAAWDVDQAISYQMLNGDPAWVRDTTSETPYTISGLIPDSTYIVELKSVCDTHASTVLLDTVKLPSYDSDLVGLYVREKTESSLLIQWGALAGHLGGELEWRDVTAGDTVWTSDSVNAEMRSHILDTLEAGHEYAVRLELDYGDTLTWSYPVDTFATETLGELPRSIEYELDYPTDTTATVSWVQRDPDLTLSYTPVWRWKPMGADTSCAGDTVSAFAAWSCPDTATITIDGDVRTATIDLEDFGARYVLLLESDGTGVNAETEEYYFNVPDEVLEKIPFDLTDDGEPRPTWPRDGGSGGGEVKNDFKIGVYTHYATHYQQGTGLCPDNESISNFNGSWLARPLTTSPEYLADDGQTYNSSVLNVFSEDGFTSVCLYDSYAPQYQTELLELLANNDMDLLHHAFGFFQPRYELPGRDVYDKDYKNGKFRQDLPVDQINYPGCFHEKTFGSKKFYGKNIYNGDIENDPLFMYYRGGIGASDEYNLANKCHIALNPPYSVLGEFPSNFDDADNLLSGFLSNKINGVSFTNAKDNGFKEEYPEAFHDFYRDYFNGPAHKAHDRFFALTGQESQQVKDALWGVLISEEPEHLHPRTHDMAKLYAMKPTINLASSSHFPNPFVTFHSAETGNFFGGRPDNYYQNFMYVGEVSTAHLFSAYKHYDNSLLQSGIPRLLGTMNARHGGSMAHKRPPSDDLAEERAGTRYDGSYHCFEPEDYLELFNKEHQRRALYMDGAYYDCSSADEIVNQVEVGFLTNIPANVGSVIGPVEKGDDIGEYGFYNYHGYMWSLEKAKRHFNVVHDVINMGEYGLELSSKVNHLHVNETGKRNGNWGWFKAYSSIIGGSTGIWFWNLGGVLWHKKPIDGQKSQAEEDHEEDVIIASDGGDPGNSWRGHRDYWWTSESPANYEDFAPVKCAGLSDCYNHIDSNGDWVYMCVEEGGCQACTTTQDIVGEFVVQPSTGQTAVIDRIKRDNFPYHYREYVSPLGRELGYLKERGFLSDDPNTVLHTKALGEDSWGILEPLTVDDYYAAEFNSANVPTEVRDFWKKDDQFGIYYTLRTNGDRVIMIAVNPLPFRITDATFDFNCAPNQQMAQAEHVDALFEKKHQVYLAPGFHYVNTNWETSELEAPWGRLDINVDLENMVVDKVRIGSTVGPDDWSNGVLTARFLPYDVRVFEFVPKSSAVITPETSWKEIWSNNGSDRIYGQELEGSSHAHEYVTGNFTNSSKGDQLLRVSTSGRHQLWNINNGAFNSITSFNHNSYRYLGAPLLTLKGVLSGDFDGNGYDELIVGYHGGIGYFGGVRHYSLKEDGLGARFEMLSRSSDLGGFIFNSQQTYLSGDFDDDGKDEFMGIVQDGNSPFYVLLNYNGSSWQWTHSNMHNGNNRGHFNLTDGTEIKMRQNDMYCAGDFNGDGKDELMIYRDEGWRKSLRVIAYEGTGHNKWISVTPWKIMFDNGSVQYWNGAAPVNLLAGNLDLDNMDELMVVLEKNGEYYYNTFDIGYYGDLERNKSSAPGDPSYYDWVIEQGDKMFIVDAPADPLKVDQLLTISRETMPQGCANSGARRLSLFNKSDIVFDLKKGEEEKPVHEVSDLADTTRIRIYPNPARESCRVDFAGIRSGSGRLTLADVNGRIVWRKDLSGVSGSMQVPLQQLTPGVYVFRLEDGETGLASQKLIVAP